MRFARAYSQLSWPLRAVFSLALLLAGSISATAACSITSGDKTWSFGVADSYQITTSGGSPNTYSATGLPPGLAPPTSTGLISGTPSAPGTYSVGLTVVFNGNCTATKTVTFIVNAPTFVGFRLPDFQTPLGAGYTPRLMLQMGANGTSTTANRFNATLEVDATGTGTWVPYNHFVGIADTNPNYSFRDSWITDAPLAVRDSSGPSGVPQAFSTAQLTLSPPAVYMKADPRANRFGVFQMDTALTTANSRILLSPWPVNDANVANGFGGTVATGFPGPVEHAPNRFSGAAYYPATFSINGPVDARDAATTTYADNDGVTRPADAIYPGSATTKGARTPYYDTSRVYHPIMLNRPFRNVGELGYAFRDLPWKTLDFFSDKSADTGLLDIFTINDGAQVLDGNGNIVGMAPPTTVAGSVNLNTTQAADVQAVLAGSILDEINSTTISPTGTGVTDAPALANQAVTAISAAPVQNKSELITRANLPTTILPTTTASTATTDDQTVKARREVVARAVSSVAQTRVWNLVIDVVAQSGHFKPNAGSLQNDFVVEGEQHYWVHVAIDRFTGQVLDKQIEVVNE
jgi:hypothetical protein